MRVAKKRCAGGVRTLTGTFVLGSAGKDRRLKDGKQRRLLFNVIRITGKKNMRLNDHISFTSARYLSQIEGG